MPEFTRRSNVVLSLVVFVCAVSALPAQEWAEAETVGLDAIGASELLWKSDRGLIPLPVVDLEIELNVTGMMVQGTVTQLFHNPTADVIEALYVFPLPERAAVHRMEMLIGERRIVSRIEERGQAKRTYEQAAAAGKKAGLVEQQRPNLFTTSVANINPGETIGLTLQYFEELRYVDGSYRIAFPLTFTPRFFPASKPGDLPWKQADSEEAIPSVPLARIRVNLSAGFPIASLLSDSHEIEVAETRSGRELRPFDGTVVADRDFLLRWQPELGRDPRAAIFTEEHGGERYALMMLMPPGPESDAGLGLPTETMFVIDVSGSMSGPSIRQAREALLAALDRLRPEDRFNILKFNSDSEVFRDGFQQAERESLEAARQWVRGLQAGGGTMIYPALMRGFGMMAESSSSRAQRIVFLTDGAVGNEQQLLTGIRERLGDARLHTIGLGNAPNRYLMRKMAQQGRGLCAFVAGSGSTENRIATFFERLDRPVLTDVELILDGMRVDEIYPRTLPDLYAGEPLLLSMRVDGDLAGGSLALGGYTRSGWRESSVSFDGREPEGTGIAVRWARAQVGSLMDSLAGGADEAAVREEVLDVALDFDLVTRYTSLVAVDDRATALGNAIPARLAGALPSGGTDRRLRLALGLLLTLCGIGLWCVRFVPRS